jgi:ABC-type branched-subunit amino acid transport system ATPase component
VADILTVDPLTKEFGRLKAVDALSFEVGQRDPGHDGAKRSWKDHSIQPFTGVFKADEGSIHLKGKDIGHELRGK